MKKSIELIKNRSDIGAGTRGSDMGIDAIEIAAINQGSDFFRRYPFVNVQTRNHSIYEQDTYIYARHIEQVYQQCKQLCAVVENSLMSKCFPLVFSGDHSSALGTIGGIQAAFPDKSLGVIWMDAHADIHSPYTTPSGNLHGMPLAAVLHQDNLECKVNEVDAGTVLYWEKLKRIASSGLRLLPEHLVYFGVRDTELAEDVLINKLGIKNYTVAEVRGRGTNHCAQEALDRLKGCDLLYVSFDVDSIDSGLIAEGTGTPVPGGFTTEEVRSLLQEFSQTDKLICMELVEVNPLLDKRGNQTAEVAFSILEHITPLISGAVNLEREQLFRDVT